MIKRKFFLVFNIKFQREEASFVLHLKKNFETSAGSAITNGREPRSCLGQVFNSMLGCISTPGSKCMVCMQPLLKLKTQPKARPVSQSLSITSVNVCREIGYLLRFVYFFG